MLGRGRTTTQKYSNEVLVLEKVALENAVLQRMTDGVNAELQMLKWILLATQISRVFSCLHPRDVQNAHIFATHTTSTYCSHS